MIPSKLWDPLVEQGVNKIETEFTRPEEQTTLEQIHTPDPSSQHQIETLQNQLREKNSTLKEMSGEIRKREETMNRIIDEMERECTVLRKGLDKNTESSTRMREDIDLEMKVKENELIKKFIDEKDKIRLSDEKERCEHKKKTRKRSKEVEAKEKELEKRVRELSKKQNEIEHKQIYSQIAPHNIYTSNRGASDKTQAHSPAYPKLSTHDGKTECRPYLIQFGHIAKNTTGQMPKGLTN